jgi:hypothetical protein
MSSASAMPSIAIRPAVGFSTPARQRISVVLPDPFGPISAMNSPRRRFRFTSLSARRSPYE